ncbi:MAG TPA: biliverdin-producing heme oxygenase [Planctomycetota bacterium]|nr:biliverdin-producing heme oxygenase [Planctomycetota bacterium]
MQPGPLPFEERASVRGPGLAARLRQAIAELHLHVESTALARAIVGSSITIEPYLALLDRLEPVHEVLEHRLAAATLEDLVPRPLVFRADALRRDRCALGRRDLSRGAGHGSLSLWLGSANGGHLVGAAYVIAGSALGSAVLRPSLVKAFKTLDQPGDGLDYHRVPTAILREAWSAFLARLERLPEDLAADAVDGARRTMTGMLDIYSSAC